MLTAVPTLNITHATVGKDLTELTIEVEISNYSVVAPLDNYDVLVSLHNGVNGERAIWLVDLNTGVTVFGIGPMLSFTTTKAGKDLTKLIIEVDISNYSVVAPLNNVEVLVGFQNRVNGERAISNNIFLASP